jgi:hypothetical protein
VILHHDLKLLIIGKEFIVENIPDDVPVDRHERISLGYFSPERASLVDAFDSVFHIGHEKQKEVRPLAFPPLSSLLALLDIDDSAAFVLTACLAGAMRHAECSAVGALDDAGCCELPSGRTPFVTSLP